MKLKLLSLLTAVIVFSACGQKEIVKPKLMWFDLSANWATLSCADSIDYYVNKCNEIGITHIILDLKNTGSAVPYESAYAPRLREWKGITRPDDYQYVDLFVDAAHSRGMKIFGAFNVFCEGHGIFRKGLMYSDFPGAKPEWQSVNYVPGKGLMPVTEIPGKATAFTNPALPEVQEYEIAILVEAATKFKLDGIIVDRTRYDSIQSDFSDFSREQFEKYIGEKIERYPEDIYEWVDKGEGGYTKVEGKYFKQWIEWRAGVIYNFFKDARAALKSARPDVQFAAYTGAWYPSYFEVGANWASRDYDPSMDFDWASPKYKDYAYAELLDLYTNGNYYWNVTLEEYRKSNGTYKNETDSELSKGEHLCVEGACIYSRKLLGDNKFCGGLYVEDYKKDPEQFMKAVQMNLKMSDGLMIFDIVHIINRDWWNYLDQAINGEPII